MKVIIAGGREITDYTVVLTAILNSGFTITRVVSGGARGVDTLGEQFARDMNLPCDIFPADWNKNGRGAGHIRNAQMAEYGEALIAIWDGESRGTKNMIETATRRGLQVYVERIK